MGPSEVSTLLKGTMVDQRWNLCVSAQHYTYCCIVIKMVINPCTVPCTHLPLLICPLDLNMELAGSESGPGSARTPRYPAVVGCGFNHGSGRGIHLDCAHRHVVFMKGGRGQADLLRGPHCGCLAGSLSGSPPAPRHTPSR